MLEFREVNKIVNGNTTMDGAGVKLVRVLGIKDVYDFDPFLMLDAFDSKDPNDYTNGFPWHPHRGIETFTYLISGKIEHEDSLGNKGVISNGDCQWMTAGSGILHQEMPKESDQMLGIQLWINLPSKYKMVPPKYRNITSTNIPIIEEKNVKIKVVAGTYKEIEGLFQGDYIKPLFLDIHMDSNFDWIFNSKSEETLFIYIIQGKGYFDKNHKEIIAKNVVLFNNGRNLSIKSGENGIRFLLIQGKKIKEPIAWGGPIVMNTKEELKLAFKELDEGVFIKK